MNVFKYLLLLGMAGLLAGCNLELVVPKGGYISSTGSGDCWGETTCVIEVSDTSYSETYVAIPNSGYEFVKWENGENALCGDSTNPICTVSTIPFNGNTQVEAVIASDTTLYLRPVFQPGLPEYVVRDGDGSRLGDVYDVSNDSATSRLVYTDGEGVEHGYGLSIYTDKVLPVGADRAYWSSSSCMGDYTHRLSPSSPGMEPLFSSSYVFASHHDPAEYDLVELASEGQAETLELYYLEASGADPSVLVCTLWAEASAVPVVTIEARDFTSQFKPPFTLHLE